MALALILGCSNVTKAATGGTKIDTNVTDLTTGQPYDYVPVINGHQLRLRISVKTTKRASMKLKVPAMAAKGSNQYLRLVVKEKGQARSICKIKIAKSPSDCWLTNDIYVMINGKKLSQAQAAHVICGKASLRLPKGKNSIVLKFKYDKMYKPEPPKPPKESKNPEAHRDGPIGPCEACREHFKEIWGYHASTFCGRLRRPFARQIMVTVTFILQSPQG